MLRHAMADLVANGAYTLLRNAMANAIANRLDALFADYPRNPILASSYTMLRHAMADLVANGA